MKYSLYKNIRYVYKKVFRFNKSLKIVIPLFIIFSILIPFIGSVIPAVAINIISNKLGIMFFVLTISGISIIYMIINYFKTYLENKILFENTFVRIKEFYIDSSIKLMKTDYANVEPQDKQILIQKQTNSINSNWVGPEFMMKNTPMLIINIIGLLGYGILISSINYYIIIILVIMTILNFILSLYARRYEEKHKNKYTKYDREVEYLYENSISLINGKDVRIYKMENWFYNLFRQLIKKRVKWHQRVEMRYFLPVLSDSILLAIRDLIGYSILVLMVIDNDINITNFTFFIGIISGFSTWLNQSVEAYTNLKRANLGVNDYRNYEEIKNKFLRDDSKKVNFEFPLPIEFKNVSFRYPNDDKDTIKNLNLKIEGGSKIALVGINGAGKTTLVKLLSGLYYPTNGDIFIGGVNIKDIDIEEYYKLIGVVFQDVEILAFTIAKNITCTQDELIDKDKLWKCLDLAGLKEKVESLKDQENTFLTQTLSKDGLILSGGQLQKLMLARALYKDSPILILDEPTAALDPIAESKLYEDYNLLIENKTSLFISHRLSSTKFCDRILFLENGQIVEDGTHESLLKMKGKYAHMFNIQSHYYKEDGGNIIE